jgi:thiamine phosphate synthase YjbQ (UPF0047 family)
MQVDNHNVYHLRGQRRRAHEAGHNVTLRVMGREVMAAITEGRLDFGPWEQVFSGQAEGLARRV